MALTCVCYILKHFTMANSIPKCCRLQEYVCLVYLQSVFFVKNRELRPDKNKFTFALGKLTTELAEIR